MRSPNPALINVAEDAVFLDRFGDEMSVRFNGSVGITAYGGNLEVLSFLSLTVKQFDEIHRQVTALRE